MDEGDTARHLPCLHPLLSSSLGFCAPRGRAIHGHESPDVVARAHYAFFTPDAIKLCAVLWAAAGRLGYRFGAKDSLCSTNRTLMLWLSAVPQRYPALHSDHGVEFQDRRALRWADWSMLCTWGIVVGMQPVLRQYRPLGDRGSPTSYRGDSSITLPPWSELGMVLATIGFPLRCPKKPDFGKMSLLDIL